MESVASEVGLSPRQLRRRVRSDLGIGLKAFARMLRVLAVITEADRASRPRWAALAADAGYADQAHLVRDCQALCGRTPGDLHRERRAEAPADDRNVQAGERGAA